MPMLAFLIAGAALVIAVLCRAALDGSGAGQPL